jgi:hypothetical protein
MTRYGYKIHLCRRKYITKNYRLNSIMEVLKFSYLNLNNCKVFQSDMGVILLDSLQ